MSKIKIVLFFTFDVSLELWKRLGLLKRELLIYDNLIKDYNCEFTIITFGNQSDLKIKDINSKIKVIPIYSIIKKEGF